MDIQQRKFWKILLIGDHCLDIYHYGVCDRLSPEAPVPVLKQTKVEIKMGMSSNVASNLRSFGIEVDHQKNETTIKKHRFIDSRFNQHILRFDEGEEAPVDEFDIQQLVNVESVDAVVISDYDKGFLQPKTITQICKIFNNTPIFVDSKKQYLSCFTGCYIKINEREFSNIKDWPTESEFLVTLGQNGAIYDNKNYPTVKTEVFDICGAGDVFISALVYGFLERNSIEDAIPLANRCAAYSVSKMGTYVLSEEEINDLCI